MIKQWEGKEYVQCVLPKPLCFAKRVLIIIINSNNCINTHNGAIL
jgi:hypothetical protein